MRSGPLRGSPTCPACGKLVDGVTHLGNAKPSPEDFTICLYCLAVLRFTEKMQLCLHQGPVPEELRSELARVMVITQSTRKIMKLDRPGGTKN